MHFFHVTHFVIHIHPKSLKFDATYAYEMEKKGEKTHQQHVQWEKHITTYKKKIKKIVQSETVFSIYVWTGC